MKHVRGILFALLASLTTGALAADAKGQFAMKGAGFLTCQIYIAEREKRSEVYYLIAGWIEGFVSAHNRYVPDTFDITSFESTEMLLTVIHSHCKDHLEDRMFPVVNSMLNQLQADRIKSETELMTVTSGERKAPIYVETVRRIQENLKKRGLYKGAVDGKYTNATEAAVMAFQSDVGLEKTGFPDQVTLWKLFRK